MTELDNSVARPHRRDILGTMSGGVNEETRATYCNQVAEIERILNSARKHFDDLAKTHTKMCRQHNCGVGINQLPPEILSAIFLKSLRLSSQGDCNPFSLTQVCSYWRVVALGYAALWAKVDMSLLSLNHALACFDRAGGCLLKILSCDVFHNESHRQILLAKLSSVDVLGLSNEWQDWGPLQPAFRSIISAAPTNPLLVKEFSCELRHYVQDLPKDTFVLDVPLFNGQTPLLRHVSFRLLRMPWSRGFYSNLTTLRIEDGILGKISPLDKDICDVLRDSPRLEELTLRFNRHHTEDITGGMTMNSSPLATTERIQLHSLRTLCLRMPVDYAYHVLGSVNTYSVLQARINIGELENERDETCMVSLCQPEILPLTAFSHIDALMVDAYTIYDLSEFCVLRGYRRYGLDYVQDILGEAPSFRLEWHYPNTNVDHLSFILEHLVDMVGLYVPPLLHKVTLRADFDAPSSLPLWARIPSQRLNLLGGAVSAVFPVSLRASETGVGAAPLRNLEVLTIESPDYQHKVAAGQLISFIDWCEVQATLAQQEVRIYADFLFEVPYGKREKDILRQLKATNVKGNWKEMEFTPSKRGRSSIIHLTSDSDSDSAGQSESEDCDFSEESEPYDLDGSESESSFAPGSQSGSDSELGSDSESSSEEGSEAGSAPEEESDSEVESLSEELLALEEESAEAKRLALEGSASEDGSELESGSEGGSELELGSEEGSELESGSEEGSELELGSEEGSELESGPE